MLLRPILAAALLSPLIAAPVAAQQVEIEYPEGSLAYDSILAQRYAAAEQRLRSEPRIPRDDPARLINHGYVLAKMGRHAEASKLFNEAAKAAEIELVLADGRTMSSRKAALLALQSVSVERPGRE